VNLDLPLPPSSGSLQASNAAKIRNAGVEANLNVRAISTPNTELTLGFNYAQNRNACCRSWAPSRVQLPRRLLRRAHHARRRVA
jgi:hypothetical protein